MSASRMFASMVTTAATLVALMTSSAAGQDRVFEQDGMLYREVRTVDRLPLSRVEWEEQQQVVQVEQYSTVFREVPESIAVPVIDYRFQPTGGAPMAYPDGTVIPGQWVPYTRWETRTEIRRVPQTVRQIVPGTRVVRVPVRHLGWVEQERLNRFALGPAPPKAPAAAAAPPYVARSPGPAPPSSEAPPPVPPGGNAPGAN